jgi:hypothetical protein
MIDWASHAIMQVQAQALAYDLLRRSLSGSILDIRTELSIGAVVNETRYGSKADASAVYFLNADDFIAIAGTEAKPASNKSREAFEAQIVGQMLAMAQHKLDALERDRTIFSVLVHGARVSFYGAVSRRNSI